MNIYYDVEDNHYRTYPDGDIATIDQMRELIENKNVSIVKLQQENKQLKDNIRQIDNSVDKLQKQLIKEKDNWNKLKEIIKKKFVAQGGFTSYEWNDLLNELLDKMRELKQGSDSNVKD